MSTTNHTYRTPADKLSAKKGPATLIDEAKLTNRALNVNTMFINDVNITKHVALKCGAGAAFLNKECDPVTCMSQFDPSLCFSSVDIAGNR